MQNLFAVGEEIFFLMNIPLFLVRFTANTRLRSNIKQFLSRSSCSERMARNAQIRVFKS